MKSIDDKTGKKSPWAQVKPKLIPERDEIIIAMYEGGTMIRTARRDVNGIIITTYDDPEGNHATGSAMHYRNAFTDSQGRTYNASAYFSQLNKTLEQLGK